MGLGPIGNLHASLYQEIAGGELVGVCDIGAARADAKRFGVPAFASVSDLLAGARHIVVTGNRIGNSCGNDTQSHGVSETANSGDNVIHSNELSGNVVGALRLLGTSTIARDNLGVEEKE